jgi:hypothetical protein
MTPRKSSPEKQFAMQSYGSEPRAQARGQNRAAPRKEADRAPRTRSNSPRTHMQSKRVFRKCTVSVHGRLRGHDHVRPA